jgi:predicted dehydrogenase
VTKVAETYRAAIIGTHGISNTHAGYYKKHPRVELVAGADINEENLNTWCDAQEVEARYLDVAQMLAEVQPDIVSVCTWNSTHPELSVQAAEAGVKAVISEKPMGEDYGGPADAVARLQELGCYFVVHHQTRFSSGYNAAKQLIADGAIGSPVTVHWTSGRGLLNIGSHLIDNCRWILGDPEWTSVVGWIQRNTDRYERGSWCEEKTHALIEFEGGHQMILSIDMSDQQKSSAWSFVGPEGSIRFDRGQAVLYNDQPQHDPLSLAQEQGYLDELISWMEGGPEHRNVAREALVTQQIMMAIYQSARVRERVEPPYDLRECPLEAMIAAGELPADGEPYDISHDEALEYVRERYSRGA